MEVGKITQLTEVGQRILEEHSKLVKYFLEKNPPVEYELGVPKMPNEELEAIYNHADAVVKHVKDLRTLVKDFLLQRNVVKPVDDMPIPDLLALVSEIRKLRS